MNSVRKVGQIGAIMSEPASFRKDAAPNTKAGSLLSLFLGIVLVVCANAKTSSSPEAQAYLNSDVLMPWTRQFPTIRHLQNPDISKCIEIAEKTVLQEEGTHRMPSLLVQLVFCHSYSSLYYLVLCCSFPYPNPWRACPAPLGGRMS